MESMNERVNRLAISVTKMEAVIQDIMRIMKKNKMNIAEAEALPQILERRIEENNKMNEKTRLFEIHENPRD